MDKRYIMFDTETNGLPKSWSASMTNVDNWPRIIQLAWSVYHGDTLESRSVHLIKPEGWTIPKAEFWIKHGYSTEKSLVDGVALANVLREFIEDAESCDFMVAHNISFDHPVVGAEMLRLGYRMERKLEKICTMKQSTAWCKIPGPYGVKWPKLEELHRKLFGRDFDGAHDAGFDVDAMAACFFELLKRGIIKHE